MSGYPETMATSKKIIIIAGPNGAGKTTFAMEFLPNEADTLTFINADLIAAGLNPLQPESEAMQAGRLMLRMIDDRVSRGESFAFETTLSGRGYARMIREWQEQGYRVALFFLRLPMPEMSITRVRLRVLAGGHNIPEPVIRRRFPIGWSNFNSIYRDIVDEWAVYDSSGDTPKLMKENSGAMTSRNQQTPSQVKRPRDPDMIGAETAMHRAAQKARQKSFDAGLPVAVVKDGKVVWEWADGTYTDVLEDDPEVKKKV